MRIFSTAVAVLVTIVVLVAIGSIVRFESQVRQTRSLRAAGVRRTATRIANFRLPHGYYLNGASESDAGATVYLRPVDGRYAAFVILVQGQNPPFGASADDEYVRMQAFPNGARCDRGQSTATRGETIRTHSGTDVVLHDILCTGTGRRAFTYEFGRVPSKYALGIVSAFGPSANFDRAGVRALVASFP